MFTILRSEVYNTCDGALQCVDDLRIGDYCDGFEADEILIFTQGDSGVVLCYSIKEPSDWSRTLMYLPRGKLHRFRKLE